MKQLALLAFLLTLAGLAPSAFAQQASDAEVDRLLEVMRVEEQTKAFLPQMLATQKQMAERIAAEQGLDEEGRKRMLTITEKNHAALADMLAWEKVEPIYRDIYRKTFTDAEVQSLIGFYGSPAGQGFLDKMPLLMQNTMAAMQDLVMPAIKAMREELEQEMPEAETGG